MRAKPLPVIRLGIVEQAEARMQVAYPWQVWVRQGDGESYVLTTSYKTKNEASNHCTRDANSVIVHVEEAVRAALPKPETVALSGPDRLMYLGADGVLYHSMRAEAQHNTYAVAEIHMPEIVVEVHDET